MYAFGVGGGMLGLHGPPDELNSSALEAPQKLHLGIVLEEQFWKDCCLRLYQLAPVNIMSTKTHCKLLFFSLNLSSSLGYT